MKMHKISLQDILNGELKQTTVVFETRHSDLANRLKDLANATLGDERLTLFVPPLMSYTSTMVLDATRDYKSFFNAYYDITSGNDEDFVYKKKTELYKYLEINDLNTSDVDEFHYDLIPDDEMKGVVKYMMMHYPFFRIDKMFDQFYDEDVLIIGSENNQWAKEKARIISEYYFPSSINIINSSEIKL